MSLESKLAEFLKKLNGNVSFKVLFTSQFLETHSKFKDIYQFFDAANIADQKDYDIWTSDAKDLFVSENTDFLSWNDMYVIACREFADTKKQMLRDDTWKDEEFNSDNPIDNIHTYVKFSG